MSALPHPHEDLVARAARGDTGAQSELYTQYRRALFGVLLARVGPSDAEDLVHEVFMKAMDKLSTLKKPASFGAWLCTLARNRAIDHLRQRRPTEILDDDAHSVPSSAQKSADAKRAMAALMRLPEAYREPLALRLVEGLTGPEIAEKTGLTPGSVRVNLHRGMKLLKEALSD